MEKIKAGDILYKWESANRNIPSKYQPLNKEIRIEKVIVKSVGSKFLYLENDKRDKYYVDSLTLCSEYSRYITLYRSLEEIQKVTENILLIDIIKDSLLNVSYTNSKITLEQLKEIAKILNIEYSVTLNLK